MLRRGPVSGRSTEGRFLAVSRAELIAHLGGTPSTAQLVLIDRIGFLRLRLAKLDERLVREGDLSESDAKAYLGWNNALARTVRQLGLKATKPAGPDLQSYLASRRAATGAPPEAPAT